MTITKNRKKIIITTGVCPECGDELTLYKSKSYRRFIKCENPDCEFSYPVPKAGYIESSGLVCPEKKLPILIITKKSRKGS
ncbi:MAG: topoisomerase DNA-binding C4 zinc finger domain-containing protein [Promethearchaeota archaeon]